MNRRFAIVPLSLLMLCCACAGADTPHNATNNATNDMQIARVEVTPSTALLTELGEVTQFTAPSSWPSMPTAW